jgi:pyruvate/2-oxoglutarate dehydrogenase complex dihydrolipoamide acyltransferase (E2) component
LRFIDKNIIRRMKNMIRRIKNTMPTIKNTIRQFSASVNMGLKKLLTLRTLIKILITFIFTICIRVWLKKYDITFYKK